MGTVHQSNKTRHGRLCFPPHHLVINNNNFGSFCGGNKRIERIYIPYSDFRFRVDFRSERMYLMPGRGPPGCKRYRQYMTWWVFGSDEYFTAHDVGAYGSYIVADTLTGCERHQNKERKRTKP